jgi:glycosyltransferase involved in cell wall biosynthesis
VPTDDVPGIAVSAVVATYQRPQLVARAVRSALAQVPAPAEVVVVVDGESRETEDTLAAIGDPRVRVVVLGERLGTGAALNEGVGRANAEWVAFLDDDDEWLPGKLAAQLRAAEASPHELPLVSCRLLARTGSAEFVWPVRVPEPGEDMSEYLFRRRSPFVGEGLVQTSTIFAPRRLALEVPFRTGSRLHVDADWVLRASAHPGAGLEFVAGDAPYAVWNVEYHRARVTYAAEDWRDSLAWIEAAPNVTSRARASFILTHVSAAAARERSWRAFVSLPRTASRHHRPSLTDATVHAANYLVPARVRRAVAARAGIGRRPAASQA